MRPAYRTALVAIAVVALVLGGLLFMTQGGRTREGRKPIRADKFEVAAEVLNKPSNATVDEMLDRIEATEADTLGVSEASRRRRLREQLVAKRMGADKSLTAAEALSADEHPDDNEGEIIRPEEPIEAEEDEL